MKTSFTLFCFFLLNICSAQLPNNLIVLNEDAPVKKVIVTDLNFDDINEVIVMRDADDIIIYYQVNGEFVRDIYRQVEDPLFMNYHDLNMDGGHDLYYSARSFDGIEVVYGESGSPYNNEETSFGEDLLQNIVDGNFLSYLEQPSLTNILTLYSEDGTAHIYNTFPSSFFILATQHMTDIEVGGPAGQIGIGSQDGQGTVAFTDLNNNRIRKYDFTGSQFSPMIEDSTWIESYNSPYGIASTVDGDTYKFLITDKDKGALIYDPEDENFIVDDELQDPGKIYVYDIDQDGEEEVYVEDGNQIIRYTEIKSFSGKEVIYEGSSPISFFDVTDIDGDELLDMIVIEENSSDINILNHDMVGINPTLTEEVEVYPNPSSDYLIIDNVSADSNILFHDRAGKSFSLIVSNDRVDVSDLTPGLYMISWQNESTRFVSTFIKE